MKVLGVLLALVGLASFSFAQQYQKLPGPTLISPYENEVLDNGCIDRSNKSEWRFDWTEVEGARKYQLWVMHSGGRFAMLNLNSIKDISYTFSDNGYVANRNADGWLWRVRALTRAGWTEWSETREFSVEMLNTDCPDQRIAGVQDLRQRPAGLAPFGPENSDGPYRKVVRN